MEGNGEEKEGRGEDEEGGGYKYGEIVRLTFKDSKNLRLAFLASSSTFCFPATSMAFPIASTRQDGVATVYFFPHSHNPLSSSHTSTI